MSCDNGSGSNSEMQSKAPLKCRNGCGFYGTQSFEGFCSKCYKDKVKRQMQTVNLPSPSSSPLPTSSSHCSNPSIDHDISNQMVDLSVNSVESMNVQSAAFDTTQTLVEEGAVGVSLSDNAGTDPVEEAFTEATSSQPKKNRCHTCKKRVGLTGFSCRCSGLFCGLHRYSDKHDCTFNYKDAGQEEIRRNNPTIISSKITKL